VAQFERSMASYLSSRRESISSAITDAVKVASESASALAGDTFRSKTTQSARRDLEAIIGDEIERRFVAQLQRDQATLIARRQRERLRQASNADLPVGPELDSDVQSLLYRPDTLGRRHKSTEYVYIETLSGLFNLTNTLTYSLMLARGDTVCTLDHALDGDEPIRLADFLRIQDERMHPRSTLLIHGILDS
jgi:hypothetical protein